MTTENSGDTNIDTLALRAKEMLERVRASAGDAPTTTSTSAPSADISTPTQNDRDTPVEDDVKSLVDSNVVEEDVVETVETEELTHEELVQELTEDDPAEEVVQASDDQIIEQVSADDLVEEVEEVVELEDEQVVEEAVHVEVAPVETAELADEIVEDEQLDGGSVSEAIETDDEGWPDFSFSSPSKTIAADEAITSEFENVDAEITADEPDVEAAEPDHIEPIAIDEGDITDAEIVEEPLDEDDMQITLDDGDADLDDTALNLGYLDSGDVDFDGGTIDTDDLVSEIDSLTVDDAAWGDSIGLDLDVDTDVDANVELDADVDLDAEVDAVDTEDSAAAIATGSAIVAGAAAIAGSVDTDAPNEQARSRGLKDLSTSEPVEEDTSAFAKRRPHVDHDLNELFIRPSAPDQAADERSYPWLIPLFILGLVVIAFILWTSGSGDGESDEVDTTQQVTDDTASEQTDPTTSSTTTTTTSTTAPTTTADVAVNPDNAWGLLGEATNTGDFAALGAPFGLQQVMEQAIDADGNPVDFTLLAPSDEALAKLTDEQQAALAADGNLARDIIEYHFVDLPLTPELLSAESGQIRTRSGEIITVQNVDGEVIFNGTARLERDDLRAANGSVLVIDTVLLPPRLTEEDTEQDTEQDTADTTTTTEAPEAPENLDDVLDLAAVQFEVLSSRITPAGQTELEKAVAFFEENPDVTATIEGHTDSDGRPEKNLTLSQQRADAVRQFLISNGIAGDRLDAIGFGQERPIIVNGVEDKVASRRIEFVLN